MPHITENDVKLLQTILTAMTSSIFEQIDYVKVAEVHKYVDQSSARRSARKLLQKLAGKEGKVEVTAPLRNAVKKGKAKDGDAVAPKKAKRTKASSKKTAPEEPFVLASENDDEEQRNAAADDNQDQLSGEVEAHA